VPSDRWIPLPIRVEGGADPATALRADGKGTDVDDDVMMTMTSSNHPLLHLARRAVVEKDAHPKRYRVLALETVERNDDA